jgi:hypothetical protein
MKLSNHRDRKAVADRAERFRPILDEFAALPAIAAAAALNERNVASPRGGQWYAAQVIRMRKRLAAGPRSKRREGLPGMAFEVRFHGQASCRVRIRSHTFGWRRGGHLHPHEQPLHLQPTV